MTTAWRTALLASAAGFAVPAQAQDIPPTATAASPRGPLEDIVVTARRREENLQETPISVSAFSGATLEKMNVQEVAKVALFTPSLEITESGTSQGVGVSMRGIATYDPILTNEPSVGIYIDGVYVNALSYGQFDLTDLERVEVLRGPQGTLFGRNTTGGAINIVTRKPSQDMGFRQTLGLASNNELLFRSRFDTGDIMPGWRATLLYQYRQRDGWVNDLNKPDSKDPGAQTSHTAHASLHGEIGPDLSVDYTFDYIRRRDYTYASQFAVASDAYAAFFGRSLGLGGDPLRVSADRLGTIRLPESVQPSRNRSYNHALTLAYDVTPDITLKSITGHRDWKSAELSVFGSSAGMVVPILNPLDGSITNQTIDPYIGGGTKKLKQFTQEIQLLGRTDRLQYTIGGFYYDADYAEDNPQTYVFVIDAMTAVNGAGRLAYQGSTKSYAAFGQASYTPPILNDALELTVGLRYTKDKKSVDTQVYPNGAPPPVSSSQRKTFNNTSYNVTVNYKWTGDISTYARVGTGYRAGGFSPRGFDGPAYDPEKAITYELGLKSELLDRRVRFNLSGYITDYKDLQITQPGFSQTAGFVSNVVNAGKAEYKGFELEMTAAPVDGLTLQGDLGYVDPQYKEFLYPVNGEIIDVKDDAKFGYVSKWSAHAGFRYEFPATGVGTISIGADYSYKSGRVFESLGIYRDVLAAGKRHDLSARFSVADIPFGPTKGKFSIYGENLTNEHYRISTIDFDALGFGTAIYNRPRVIGAQLEVDF